VRRKRAGRALPDRLGLDDLKQRLQHRGIAGKPAHLCVERRGIEVEVQPARATLLGMKANSGCPSVRREISIFPARNSFSSGSFPVYSLAARRMPSRPLSTKRVRFHFRLASSAQVFHF
jgi:hypothetical protein